MDVEYRIEDLKALLSSHLNELGYEVEEDKVLDDEIPWRPQLFASKDQEDIAIDIRLTDKITDFWINIYKKTYEKIDDIKIFIAIAEDIVVPFKLGKKLEEKNVGIILVSDEGINFILEPRSHEERKATKAIRRQLDARIEESSYQDLEQYVKEINDAVNIFEIGCPREAIGLIGRVLETSIYDYLIEANRKHKVALSGSRRKSMNFDTKINFLASDNNINRKKRRDISQSEKSKMLSIKWDRNIGDHPATTEEVNQLIQDSRAILELGINMIRIMKIKREAL